MRRAKEGSTELQPETVVQMSRSRHQSSRAAYMRWLHEFADKAPDARAILARAFRRSIELSPLDLEEFALWISEISGEHVEPGLLREWMAGACAPPAHYTLIAFWLAGPRRIEIAAELTEAAN